MWYTFLLSWEYKYIQYKNRAVYEVLGHCVCFAKGSAETLKLNMTLIFEDNNKWTENKPLRLKKQQPASIPYNNSTSPIYYFEGSFIKKVPLGGEAKKNSDTMIEVVVARSWTFIRDPDSIQKSGYSEGPNPDPDSTMLDPSKPDPDPNILIFKSGYPDPIYKFYVNFDPNPDPDIRWILQFLEGYPTSGYPRTLDPDKDSKIMDLLDKDLNPDTLKLPGYPIRPGLVAAPRRADPRTNGVWHVPHAPEYNSFLPLFYPSSHICPRPAVESANLINLMTEDLEEGELVSEEVKVNQPIQTKKGRKSQQSTSNKNARRNIASTRDLKLMKVQTGAKKIPFGSYEVIFLM
ncbi:hypothetical protein YC2023_082959 [Brassica napus]